MIFFIVNVKSLDICHFTLLRIASSLTLIIETVV